MQFCHWNAMFSLCCVSEWGLPVADAKEESGFQTVYQESTSIKRGGIEAGWTEEIELQAQQRETTGKLVVVSFFLFINSKLLRDKNVSLMALHLAQAIIEVTQQIFIK